MQILFVIFILISWCIMVKHTICFVGWSQKINAHGSNNQFIFEVYKQNITTAKFSRRISTTEPFRSFKMSISNLWILNFISFRLAACDSFENLLTLYTPGILNIKYCMTTVQLFFTFQSTTLFWFIGNVNYCFY